MSAQGTEAMNKLAEDLVESAEHVRGGYHLGRAANLMERAAETISRLAPLDPDLDVQHGEN